MTRFLPRSVIAGRYVLERLIGTGGMAEVWEARHVELNAPVAVKIAAHQERGAERFKERFRTEARALAQHRCPDLVQLYDVGEHEDVPFLVMELLRGESLKLRLSRDRALPPPCVVEFVRCICRALSVIHSAKLVHRDITPANIFLLEGESPGAAKLLDLGIVKLSTQDSHTTTTGTIIGSPAYMSPEQARAEPVDARSDLWSLAAVVYRALAGYDAFEGRSVTEVLLNVCSADIPKLPPHLLANRGLDTFFERGFARNPDNRWQTATEFAEMLGQALAEPTEAAARDIPRRLGHPLGFAAAGVALAGC